MKAVLLVNGHCDKLACTCVKRDSCNIRERREREREREKEGLKTRAETKEETNTNENCDIALFDFRLQETIH